MVLIKNGLIVDGTGVPGYKSDILIKEDIIQEINRNIQQNNQDCKIIDASNRIISPGFIDMHSHADLTILQVNKAESYLMQGVTTLVVGMCGIGLAPANDIVRKYYATLVKSIMGQSELHLFDSLKDFTNELEQVKISPNLAFFIPHGNVRAYVLGMDNRTPTENELQIMKDLIKQDMESGAFGLSTGLIYPPGIITPKEELIELSKVVSKYGGIYDSHMRNEGTGVIDEGMNELIDIARKANIQAQISHWKAGSSTAWDLTPEMIKVIANARKEGLNIYADLYPYEESSTSLSGVILKPWVYNDFNENLTNPHTRKKIIEESIKDLASKYIGKRSENMTKSALEEVIFSYFKQNVRIISVIHNHQIEGYMLGEALNSLYPNVTPSEALLNFMRDEAGSIMISVKQMSERKSIKFLFKQNFVSIGSDGFLVVNSNTHPRSYGTFPKILGRYVRDKKILSLDEGIRKMTSLPASILHLKDRGIIKPGFKADLVIFDPETIIDKATYKNGRQYPQGIDYVLVNGKITIEKGKHTGVLNGQILKHNKINPTQAK
jgi:N-acyl-D-amino-acid deacylase